MNPAAPSHSAPAVPPSSSPSPSPSRPTPPARGLFAHFLPIATRWMDNDAYGHLNNVVHYSLFDTAVNRWLVERGALDIQRSAVIGLVVQSSCHYFAELAFPQTVHAGLRVARRGRSSVTYAIGLFADDAPLAAASGSFVHVYVDRATRKPLAALPPALAAALEPLLTDLTETA